MRAFLTLCTILLLVSCTNEEPAAKAPDKSLLPLIGGVEKRTLINGVVVDPKDYPAIVWLSHCTATVVGPRAILTAGHCAKSGTLLKFKANGKDYTAMATRSELYATRDHDISLAYTNKKVTGIKYRSIQVERDARQFERLMLTGYGCTQPGGGGSGNDGSLRIGFAYISSPFTKGMDLVLKPLGEEKAALCFGDSGGPAIRASKKIIGVNSKGNISDTSYVLRTDIPESKDFISQWALANKTEVCGVTIDCDKEPKPKPKPKPEPEEPKQFHFKNDFIEIQGVVN